MLILRKTLPYVNFLSSYFLVIEIFKENKTILKLLPPFFYKRYRFEMREFKGGGLTFFSFHGGAQHPLGPENPLKSIDFTGPVQGGGLSPLPTTRIRLCLKYI